MNDELRRSVFVSAGWYTGLLLIVTLLLGGTFVRLNSRRSEVASRRVALEDRRAALDEQRASSARLVRRRQRADVLRECSELAGSEAARIAELSALARASGVRLVSLRSLDVTDGRNDPDGATLVCTHELKGEGSYRQLAQFFDAIYAARGLASIDALAIERAPQGPSGPLRAALAVSWHAPSSDELERGSGS